MNVENTRADSKVFDAYSRYYDLLYSDKDYVGEVGYIDSLLQRHNVSGPELLEFGSGTGKHGCLLAEKGYRIHGIERSPEMVSQASCQEGFSCEVGDVCSFHLDRSFDAVLSLFHVVSYQVTNSNTEAIFARAAEHLKSSGLFLFDIWYSPAVYAQRPEVRVKRMADNTVDITRIAEPIISASENRVDVNYTIIARNLKSGECQVLKESHPMRHYSLPELKFIAKASGFEWILAEEFLTGCEPSEKTWGVCVVLRKT